MGLLILPEKKRSLLANNTNGKKHARYLIFRPVVNLPNIRKKSVPILYRPLLKDPDYPFHKETMSRYIFLSDLAILEPTFDTSQAGHLYVSRASHIFTSFLGSLSWPIQVQWRIFWRTLHSIIVHWGTCQEFSLPGIYCPLFSKKGHFCGSKVNATCKETTLERAGWSELSWSGRTQPVLA